MSSWLHCPKRQWTNQRKKKRRRRKRRKRKIKRRKKKSTKSKLRRRRNPRWLNHQNKPNRRKPQLRKQTAQPQLTGESQGALRGEPRASSSVLNSWGSSVVVNLLLDTVPIPRQLQGVFNLELAVEPLCFHCPVLWIPAWLLSDKVLGVAFCAATKNVLFHGCPPAAAWARCHTSQG